MSVVFAVDSSALPDSEVQPGLTLYDDVLAWAGIAVVPVWFLYLGSGGGAAKPATPAAVQFLHGRGTSVGLFYNSSTLNGVAQGTYELGLQDAAEAAQQAAALGVPPGTYVWNDVEYKSLDRLTGDYIAGWCDGMRGTTLAGSGGIYANLLDARFQAAMTAALGKSPKPPANVRRLLLFLASWTVNPPGVTVVRAPGWLAAGGPAGLPAQIRTQCYGWQYCGRAYGDANDGPVDLSLINLPLPSPGDLWLPPSGPSTQSVRQQLDQVASDLDTNLARLRQLLGQV